MAIDQKKYIEIVSGVGGESEASRRELIARVMTTNALAPIEKVLEFSDLDGVLDYFGSDSSEYAYASKYFSFISKSITQADKISFARYATEATAPSLTSTVAILSTTDYASVSNGSATISIDKEDFVISFDTSSITTFDDVADILTLAIQENTAGGAMWTSATMEYIPISDGYPSGQFVITGGITGEAEIGYMTAGGTGEDVSTYFGLDSDNDAVISFGVDVETPVEALARVSELSNNFGSFSFMETLTNDEITELAEWNTAQNYMYLYSVATTAANASALATVIDGNTGTIVTLDPFADYAEYMPMALFATTDYDDENSVKNFMYQMFDTDEPSVTTDEDSDTYDAMKINYLGATQQAGQTIAFYQDGVMMDGGDVGPYCNEIWLKDAVSTEFLNLMLALEQIPANDTGASLGSNAVLTIITEALSNGTIQSGKTLTSIQKAYITQVSGDADAYIDVQSIGYWLDVTITSDVEDEVTIYKLNYVLIYSKGDSIRKVEGTDILI